jgi:hypothetical protein
MRPRWCHPRKLSARPAPSDPSGVVCTLGSSLHISIGISE